MGQPEKYVRVEKDEKNKIKLIEVDSNGETIDDIETDMGETKEFPGQDSPNPSYRRPPKPNFFETLEEKEAFDIDEPQA